MPRAYGHKFLMELQKADSNRLGVRLGRACVDANLPASYVADILQISRMTIYSWFRGGGVREDKRGSAEALLKILEEDLENHRLPVDSISGAKRYLQDITGVQV